MSICENDEKGLPNRPVRSPRMTRMYRKVLPRTRSKLVCGVEFKGRGRLLPHGCPMRRKFVRVALIILAASLGQGSHAIGGPNEDENVGKKITLLEKEDPSVRNELSALANKDEKFRRTLLSTEFVGSSLPGRALREALTSAMDSAGWSVEASKRDYPALLGRIGAEPRFVKRNDGEVLLVVTFNNGKS